MKIFKTKTIIAITTTLILMGCGQDPPPKASKDSPAGSSPTNNPVDSEGKPVVTPTEAPADLSYTTRQLIEVNTNRLLFEGEKIHQPIKAPDVKSFSAKILKKINTDLLSINTINGNFLALAKIDSGNFYSVEKAIIKKDSKPNNYNIALTILPTAPAVLADFTVGAQITSAAGAKGLIVAKVGSVIYIRFLTPTVNSPDPSDIKNAIITFTDNDPIRYVNTIQKSAAILEIDASNLILTIPSVTNFTAGHDITSDNNHSGYIYASTTNMTETIIKIDEINQTGSIGLRKNQNILNKEIYTAIGQQLINKVSHDNLLVIDRGFHRVIHANVSKGTGITFSISPPLPDGLKLDPSTGTISGIAEFKTDSTLYVVTAKNTLGSTYYAFNMEVRDYFTFAEASGAQSFLTHKIGSSKTSRACRINANDIFESNPLDPLTLAGLDIGCSIEAEEMDLFKTDLKLSAKIGPAICEYVTFTPFSFWQFAPIKTSRKIDVITGCSPTASQVNPLGEQPKTEDYCLGNYSNVSGPNCDSGQLTVTEWSANTTVDASGASDNSCAIAVTKIIQCGGKKNACLSGPVKSVLSDEDIDNGYLGVYLESFEGLEKEWLIDSPYKLKNKSNLRNANGFLGNSCTDSRADASAWIDVQDFTLNTMSPFSNLSPFYEFNCLDAAKDVKARIRLRIRDWDRAFKIENNITALNPAGSLMDTTTKDPFGLYWNNYFDWDNNYKSTLPLKTVMASSCGALPVGICTNGTSSNINDCKSLGFTWNDPGVCRTSMANVKPASRSTCELAGETWIPTEGCTNPAKLTQATCNDIGEKWAVKEFPFPGSSL